jgi:alkylhydroperoxidase family enzyme
MTMQARIPSTRIDTIAAWREAPYFAEDERASLALAKAVTRLTDPPPQVPDQWVEQIIKEDQRSQ